MNILLVTHPYPEPLTEGVVDRLRRRGHVVEVLCDALRLTSEFPAQGPGVEARLAALQQCAEYNRDRTAEALLSSPADVVLCWSLNRISLGPVHAARDLGVPVVVFFQDAHARQYRSPLRHAAWQTDVQAFELLARYPMATWHGIKSVSSLVSSQSLRDLLADDGVPMGEAEVILPGVAVDELPCRPSLRQSTDPLQILYVGPLRAARGVDTLLRACQQLASDVPWTLDLVGDGSPAYQAELENLVEEPGLGPRVRFVSEHSALPLNLHYHTHHVLVAPSEWPEPVGLAPLQAMAAGCAVVSTATGCCAEVIRDGQNALVCRPGSAKELADCLRDLSTHEHTRQQLIDEARSYVVENHDLEDCVSRLEGFLQKQIGA